MVLRMELRMPHVSRMSHEAHVASMETPTNSRENLISCIFFLDYHPSSSSQHKILSDKPLQKLTNQSVLISIPEQIKSVLFCLELPVRLGPQTFVHGEDKVLGHRNHRQEPLLHLVSPVGTHHRTVSDRRHPIFGVRLGRRGANRRLADLGQLGSYKKGYLALYVYTHGCHLYMHGLR